MNASKAKGTRYESEVRDFLTSHGFDVRRVAQMGRADQGDLHGYPMHIIEAKSVKTFDLPSFIRQADREAVNAGEPFGVVFIKKARARTGDGYAVRSIATDVRMVARARDMEEALKDASFDLWYDIDEEHRRVAQNV